MIDLTGKRFERLLVIKESIRHIYPNGRKARAWLCKCDCGNEKRILQASLTNLYTKSCGCYAIEKAKTGKYQAKKHGMSTTPIFKIWAGMLQRCNNPNLKHYHLYGGRGIKACARWESFDNFYYDMGDRPSDKHSIDRIDNDGDYCPENCRWATGKQQGNNTRRNVYYNHNGKSLTIAEWSRLTGIKISTLYARLNVYGWSINKSLTKKVA